MTSPLCCPTKQRLRPNNDHEVGQASGLSIKITARSKVQDHFRRKRTDVDVCPTSYGGKLRDLSLVSTQMRTSLVRRFLTASLSSGKGASGLTSTTTITPLPERLGAAAVSMW